MTTKRIASFILLLIFPAFIWAQTTEDNTYYDASYKIGSDTSNTKGNEFINVISYNIKSLQIIPEKKLLRAITKVTIKPTKNLNSFYLDFHNSNKILSLKVNDTIADWRFEHGHNLYIKPQMKIKQNTLFTVEVKYYNTKNNVDLWNNALFEDDFIFTNIPNYLLFPSNEILGDRAFYKVNITIPENYKLASFGETKNNTKYNYTVKDESTLSINNFTLNLLKDYSTFSIDGPKVSLTSRVSINQYTPIDSTIVFEDIIKRVPNQMAFLDSILGYYPYKNFNVVVTKEIIRKGLYNSRSTVIIPYAYTLDSTEVSNKILNGLVKQWFGNKVNVKDEKDLWITEGFSKYMEWLLIEQQVGKVEFNKMMNSKLVEARKYIGKVDWHEMNPFPLYQYDLKNITNDFGNLSKTKIIKGDDVSFFYKAIGLNPKTLSDSIRDDFMHKFGHSVDEYCIDGHSYYELMNWAREQKNGNFKISTDGFYTLISVQENEFKTHIFKLADPGDEYKYDFTIPIRGALFLHAIRLYFGDELFFKKILNIANHFSGASLSTQYFVDALNRDTNGELKDYINKWLYSDTEIPSFLPKRKPDVK